MKPHYFPIVILLYFSGFFLPIIHAQVAIAPSFVFIDERSGIGNLFVSNNGNEPQEITLSFRFGYPATDSLGNQVMNYDDPVAFGNHALDPVIRAFPRSFILPAGSRQTVRLQVIPSGILTDGFYFTRLRILARPLTPDQNPGPEPKIATRIQFNFEQVTAVFYRRGKVMTGLSVDKLSVDQDNKVLKIRPYVKQQGNAPFIGSMTVRLLDGKGKMAAKFHHSTAVYFEASKQIEMDISGLEPGEYTLELGFETQRNDMMSSDLVQSVPIAHEKKLTIFPFSN